RALEQEWKIEMELGLMSNLKQKLEQEQEQEQELLDLKVLLSPELVKEFGNEAFKVGICNNIPKGFLDLVYKINRDIFICMSPERKWIIESNTFLKMCVLSREDQEKHFCNYGKPEYRISEVVRFTFTNDDLYFVYLSVSSLHALSLQTGTIFTSVSGCNLYYFTRERQVGYLFRSGTEEIAILLSSLFSPFKFFPVSRVKPSVVGKSIAAVFCSSDIVISVSSDSKVSLMQTTEDRKGISFISQSSLTMAGQQEPNVKNCVFSTDGKLMAIHQGTKVQMYSFAESGLKTEFLYTVFEAECELLVTCFTFSADSTSLLFCIQDSGNDQHFYVWDIQEKVMSDSFKSPAFLTVECFCCLSLSTGERLILCGEYEIEIWEYTKPSFRLLTRLGVERPYSSVTFSQCTISLDNQLLVCCIADTILVYSPHDPDINSSKRVLRGHFGRIEFCRFLKVNRYLISYGVDGIVFLWDIRESKAAGFATITQGNESIVSMAVSPEEDKVVCFTSSGRVCTIKLWELGCSLSLKPLMAPAECKMEKAETSLQLPEQIASTSRIQTSAMQHDTTESLSSSDSEEEMYYYLEYLDESD
ncbi:hypothetical protein OS493_040564, partial [Desmophyllum pertusum]